MQITIIISIENENILKNDLLDIEDWINQAAAGKINNSKKRMLKEWLPRLKERYETLPTDDSALIAKILAEPDYKDRITRDAEEAARV